MAATIVYTDRADSYFITLVQINALFAAIETVLNGKMDVRGFTALDNIIGVNTSIINVPEPAEAGDLERT